MHPGVSLEKCVPREDVLKEKPLDAKRQTKRSTRERESKGKAGAREARKR